MSKIDPESFKGKLWLLFIDKLIIGALIALAFVVYDRYRTSETQKYEEKRAQVQLDFERARLLKEFMPVITDKKLNVVDRGYMLRTALAMKSLDPEAGVEIGRELINDGISESHFRRIMAMSLPDGLPAIVRTADRLSGSYGRINLFSIFYNTSVPQPSFSITPSCLDKLKSEGIPDDILKKLEKIIGTTRVSPREQDFVDFIEETIGEEQTVKYESLILKYGTEDYRILKEFLFWRTVIEDELLSSLDKNSIEKYLQDSFVSNHLWGLFALLHSKNEERYRSLQESELRGIKVIGFLSQSFMDYESEVDKERVSNAVKYISELLDLDLKSIKNIKYARFIIGVVESYLRQSSDQAQRFSDLYPSLGRIVISDLYRNDNFNVRWRHPDFLVLQMFTTSFLESIGDHAKSCEAELISYANSFKDDVENSRPGEDLTKLKNRHSGGSVMYDVMRILGSIDSPEGKDLLEWIESLEDEKLNAFKILENL
ncbi:MAG: hypothetical protein GY774_24710 [Planctomycetes bacterium]|nr:hypothetical protein [Planctomycetota bacterium]